jgi:hypothetical protein
LDLERQCGLRIATISMLVSICQHAVGLEFEAGRALYLVVPVTGSGCLDALPHTRWKIVDGEQRDVSSV